MHPAHRAHLARVVRDALARGALAGTPGYGRTITIAGRRRYVIRVQCDVYRYVYGQDVGYFYPDLRDVIVAEADAWREGRV